MLSTGRDAIAIGSCEQCGDDIFAPQQVLVWSEEHTYHQGCYQALLEQRYGAAALG